MDHLVKKFGFLEFSASNVVFGPMQWGPVPQSVNWSKTKAFTTIRS